MTPPDLPKMEIDPPRHAALRNLSLVWLVPIFALLVSFGLAWQTYSARGVEITISFPEAAGVIEDETVVKYRDVVIGTVRDVRFSSDFKRVIVTAQIEKEVAEILPAEAEFWIVSPVVNARGITGLSTVLSGVHIEGAFLPVADSTVRSFQGLAAAPIVRPGRLGTRITLRSIDGTLLPEGAPVFYRGVEVGRLDVPRLSTSGDSAIVEAFINAPHDRYITTATRFWDTSGFSVKIGPAGVDLTVASIGALLSGGVAFDTTFSGGQTLTDETVFTLFIDENSARQSIYTQVGEGALALATIFTGSVNGLVAGAPIEFRGLRVGQVTGINAFIDTTPSGSKVVKLRASLAIEPQALGLDAEIGRTEVLEFLRAEVQRGMRARLTTSNIFSSALKIELVELPDAAEAEMVLDEEDIPILPNVDSNIPDFTATAEGVLERINGLPIEEVMKQAISLMAAIEAVAADEGTRAAPDALVKLLEDSRAFINKDETQALPTELLAAVTDLRKIVGDLQEKGAVDKLVALLDSADKAAAELAIASQDFPELVADLRDLAAKAKALKAEDLIASTTKLLDSADALIGTEAAKALPQSLSNALAEIQAALKELREGGAVANANAALASAKDAADSVSVAAKDLPKLTAELEALVGKANALVASYGVNSAFNEGTLDLLRELKEAANAVTQLARTIERNPNSLLIGR